MKRIEFIKGHDYHINKIECLFSEDEIKSLSSKLRHHPQLNGYNYHCLESFYIEIFTKQELQDSYEDGYQEGMVDEPGEIGYSLPKCGKNFYQWFEEKYKKANETHI